MLLPAARQRGVSVIAGGVFNSGLLAAPAPGATYDYKAAPQELLARAQELERVCAGYGVPLRAAAARFPLTHPAVASVLIGARSAAEITDAITLRGASLPAARREAQWEELWQALGTGAGQR